MTTASLHDIAPRLAEARDVEHWNVWIAGDEPWLGVKNGDRWAETISAKHSTVRCTHCGGTGDHYEILQRILIGPNRGRVGLILSWRCRNCKNARSRHL